jgi:hypothetical protein
MMGTARSVGIASRKTWDDAGGSAGSRNALEFATPTSDGTVRPVSAAIRCPFGPSANSRNRHATS